MILIVSNFSFKLEFYHAFREKSRVAVHWKVLQGIAGEFAC